MPTPKPLSEGGRRRHKRAQTRLTRGALAFTNPYPWMSSIEARVHLELERRGIPFSWRYFDGVSLNLKTLMPDFAPEFTLREYKVVILIIGKFWGNLPGVLDTNALAQSLLEFDGWTVVTLFENEILENVTEALDAKAPMLVNPAFRGAERPNPYGRPDIMRNRRENLRGQGITRTVFKLKEIVGSGTRKRRHVRRIAGGGNRLRRPEGG